MPNFRVLLEISINNLVSFINLGGVPLAARMKGAACRLYGLVGIVIWLFSLPFEPSYCARAKLALSFDKEFAIWTFLTF
jgi:hypothetical protein